MKISRNGVDLVKLFEGFKPRMYNDPSGNATIGYGHLVHRGPINGKEDNIFKLTLTEQQATDLLDYDLDVAEEIVNRLVTIPLGQHEFDALCSFVHWSGETYFKNSTLLRKLNLGDKKGSANEFKKWRKSNGEILPGLITRRRHEETLFMTSKYPWQK